MTLLTDPTDPPVSRDTKCLFWDCQGLCLYVKKPDRGRFVWPQAKDGAVYLTMAQFSMLLESIDWRNAAWTARPEVVV